MSKQSKRFYFLRVLAALIIVGGGILWLLKNQRSAAKKVITLLPKFSASCLLWVLLLDALQIFLMAMRFWFLYPKEHRTSIRNVFAAMSVGQTMNAFLPARAGDFYRIASLTPKPTKPDFNILTLTGILASDKLVDLASFLILIFALGSYKESSKSLGTPSPLFWKYFLGFVVALAIAWPLYLKNKFGKLVLWFFQFLKGLKTLLSPKQLFFALSMAVGVWLAEALALRLLSLYQNYPLSLTQAFFILTVLNLAIAVPISIANIGPFEASMAFAINQLGVPLESALAIATVHHGLQVTAYILTGILGWGLSRRLKTYKEPMPLPVKTSKR
jgi:uncharacterized membrane protein YbhN (UPF0104 family)